MCAFRSGLAQPIPACLHCAGGLTDVAWVPKHLLPLKCRPVIMELDLKRDAKDESAAPLQVDLPSSSRWPCLARRAQPSAAAARQAVQAPVQGRSWGGPAVVHVAQVRHNAHHHQAWCWAAAVCGDASAMRGVHASGATRTLHTQGCAGIPSWQECCRPCMARAIKSQSAASACCIRQLLMGLWVVWPAGLNSAGSVSADWRTDDGLCCACRWGCLPC